MSASIRGGSTVKANLRRFEKNWTPAKARALRRVAKKVLDQAVVLCPKDSEELAGSGRIVESETGRSVAVVFGSAESEAYALAVHDHPSVHSPASWKVAEAEGRGINWTEPGTGPKFLERPFLEEAGSYLADLSEELKVERVGIR